MTTDLPAQVPLSAGLGRWVSVRERLPDSDGPVLVYTPKNAHAKVWIDCWQVGLAERVAHRPNELSGGEQQRAAIARALMNRPELLLADEPTGNLDSRTGEEVLQYLFQLATESCLTLVLVTHNEGLAERCSRRLYLRDGQIVE